MKDLKIAVLIFSLIFFIAACKKNTEKPTEPEEDLVTQIITPEAGTINGLMGLKLIFQRGLFQKTQKYM